MGGLREECIRRSGEDEKWRGGGGCLLKTIERKNRKSGLTILYLTLTPVQQGIWRKNTHHLSDTALTVVLFCTTCCSSLYFLDFFDVLLCTWIAGGARILEVSSMILCNVLHSTNVISATSSAEHDNGAYVHILLCEK